MAVDQYLEYQSTNTYKTYSLALKVNVDVKQQVGFN